MLSIIIPTKNEASRLPLILADLNISKRNIEIIVVDCCSNDRSAFITKLAGGLIFFAKEANRGKQLNYGASKAAGEWLLFIHADSRLNKKWSESIEKIINDQNSKKFAWFFDFRIKNNWIGFKLLEIAVAIRSCFLAKPYGDQGLLISKELYLELGGYSPLFIMEDIDLIERINKKTKLRRIGLPIYINIRRWERVSIIKQSIKNAKLRYLWKRGTPSIKLAEDYYKLKE